MIQDWGRYAPYFTRAEFACRHCGREDMQPEFMDRLMGLRLELNERMPINSGYRCPQHPEEVGKPRLGAHALGQAADVGVSGATAHKLIGLAIARGFTGIGVQQRGDARYVHVDAVEDAAANGLARPMVWSY